MDLGQSPGPRLWCTVTPRMQAAMGPASEMYGARVILQPRERVLSLVPGAVGAINLSNSSSLAAASPAAAMSSPFVSKVARSSEAGGAGASGP